MPATAPLGRKGMTRATGLGRGAHPSVAQHGLQPAAAHTTGGALGSRFLGSSQTPATRKRPTAALPTDPGATILARPAVAPSRAPSVLINSRADREGHATAIIQWRRCRPTQRPFMPGSNCPLAISGGQATSSPPNRQVVQRLTTAKQERPSRLPRKPVQLRRLAAHRLKWQRRSREVLFWVDRHSAAVGQHLRVDHGALAITGTPAASASSTTTGAAS